jgi:ATP-dependent Lon protease
MTEELENPRRAELKWRGKDLLSKVGTGEQEEAVVEEPEHLLFDMKSLLRANALAGDEAKHSLGLMRVSGACRSLRKVPEDYLVRCDELRELQPNFAQFIDEVLIPSFALSHARANPKDTFISLQPTVLLGGPGVGKTMFAARLAEVFGLEFERMNLETSQASFELMGTSRGWTNAQPGRLFNWLSKCQSANGLFVFEELDKVNPDPRFSPLNPLIQLLEPTTSNAIYDQCAPELKLDVSKVNWIFTANTLSGISAPILSRLHVVEIPPLTAQQAKSVALRQYQGLIHDMNLNPAVTIPQLTPEGLEILSSESPRRQRVLLHMALGRAVAAKRAALELTPKPALKSRSIGFY